jgi:hypothetical protein
LFDRDIPLRRLRIAVARIGCLFQRAATDLHKLAGSDRIRPLEKRCTVDEGVLVGVDCGLWITLVVVLQLPQVDHREDSEAGSVAKGVNASVMRLPQVHNTIKQGLVTYLIAVAREKGVSAYLAEGRNRWAAAHVLDVASLYRLALEKHEAGAKYHAVAEEGVAMRDIAEVIGKGLKVPVVSLSMDEAQAHFGWLSMFASHDLRASSVQTRKKLGWNPTGPGLITDLERVRYSEVLTTVAS